MRSIVMVPIIAAIFWSWSALASQVNLIPEVISFSCEHTDHETKAQREGKDRFQATLKEAQGLVNKNGGKVCPLTFGLGLDDVESFMSTSWRELLQQSQGEPVFVALVFSRNQDQAKNFEVASTGQQYKGNLYAVNAYRAHNFNGWLASFTEYGTRLFRTDPMMRDKCLITDVYYFKLLNSSLVYLCSLDELIADDANGQLLRNQFFQNADNNPYDVTSALDLISLNAMPDGAIREQYFQNLLLEYTQERFAKNALVSRDVFMRTVGAMDHSLRAVGLTGELEQLRCQYDAERTKMLIEVGEEIQSSFATFQESGNMTPMLTKPNEQLKRYEALYIKYFKLCSEAKQQGKKVSYHPKYQDSVKIAQEVSQYMRSQATRAGDPEPPASWLGRASRFLRSHRWKCLVLGVVVIGYLGYRVAKSRFAKLPIKIRG